MKMKEQAMTLNLPTLLVDRTDSTVRLAEPDFQASAYFHLKVHGQVKVGLKFDAPQDDPTRFQCSLRFLDAHYEVPEGCPNHVLDLVNRLNRDLSSRFLPGA